MYDLRVVWQSARVSYEKAATATRWVTSLHSWEWFGLLEARGRRYCVTAIIRLKIDNNAAERALRVVALGRNFLFAGSDGGGQSAAAMYNLIGTAKLMDSTQKATCAPYCLASRIIPSTASRICSPGMSRPTLPHTHSTPLDRSYLLSRRPSPVESSRLR